MSDCLNDVHSSQDKHVSLYQSPLGLTNPSNHCYLNSVLQIIIHILKTNNWEKFNNNIEGDILRKILHISCLSTPSRSAILELKDSLKAYNNLFSGSNQQDACECLMAIMDIAHIGTKYYLVPDDDDDDSAISLTNSMFMSIFQKLFACRICGHSGSSQWQSRLLNIFPVQNCSIEQMILHNMSQLVHKHCDMCHRNTEHNEIMKWICLPKYLILNVNRFAYVDGRTIKRNIEVPIQARVNIHYLYNTLTGNPQITSCNCCTGIASAIL